MGDTIKKKDNMKERSMVAQRVIHQAISRAWKFTNIDIDKQMLGDVRQASQRRKQYLESQKQLKTEEERLAEAKKRKASALKELQAKKKRLEEETVEAKRSIDEEIAQLRRLWFILLVSLLYSLHDIFKHIFFKLFKC